MEPKEGLEYFLHKAALPMLLFETKPFDSDDYIFELKLDGIRALAYVDEKSTTLINKRGKDISATYPELTALHRQSNTSAIIDGELIVMTDGKPDFFRLQRRSLLTDSLKIKTARLASPVTFVAFDILYAGGNMITDLPLLKRKKILKEAISENNFIVLSRYIHGAGSEFFRLVKEKGLEGIVAKEKHSLYLPGKRSKNWLKIKVYKEDDFVICGYVPKEGGIKDLVLGGYNKKGELRERVKVSTAKNKNEIMHFADRHPAPPLFPTTARNVIWMKPHLVGTVSYMMRTTAGSLRQPVFKGLCPDKTAEDIRHNI